MGIGIKNCRAILNKSKEDRITKIRNSNLRSELGVDEIKNYIQKSKLRWFGHLMQVTEERIPIKMDRKWPRGRPRSRCLDQVGKDIEMRGGKWEEIQENWKMEIEMVGDFSVIVDPYLWKLFKNDHDDE